MLLLCTDGLSLPLAGGAGEVGRTFARELKRVLHSLSWPTELDSANRVMIPAGALTHAGIGTKVTVAGAGDCLEVWDRDRWSAYIGEQLANYSDLLKRVDDTA